MSNPKPKSGSSRGLCAWLREHLRPSAVSRVSHTKVQVLSKTTGDLWCNPSSQGNNQCPWERISDFSGEVKGSATNPEFELSKQNGVKKTSDVPVCSGKSSRKPRSFLQILPCCRGNRRTGKVAPLPVDNCQHSKQNGELKTSCTPTSSGQPSQETQSVQQRFPSYRGNQSVGKVAPMPISKCQSCMSNDNFTQKGNTQDRILSDLDMDDDISLTKPTYLPSVSTSLIGKQLEREQRIPRFEKASKGRLLGKLEEDEVDEKKLPGKKYEAKQSRDSENQRHLRNVRGGRRGGVPKERGGMISLGHGDNRSSISPGFLLHSKPSRGAAPPTRRGRQVQEINSIQREPTPYKRCSWTSQSSMYDIWQRTGECEDETKLADGDSRNSLTPSEYKEQEVCSAEPSELVGRSHIMKPKWFTDFNKTNDPSKPKSRRVLVANEGSGKEEVDFLIHDNCIEQIYTTHGAPTTGQNQSLRDLGISSDTNKYFDFDTWRNDLEEDETLENILEEEEDSQQSSVDLSCQLLVLNTWHGSNECEENTSETAKVPSEESPASLSKLKHQESIPNEPSKLVNRSDSVNQAWFTEHNVQNGEIKRGGPETHRGLVVKASVDKNSSAEEFDILTREDCGAHENVGPCDGNKEESVLLRDQKKKSIVDIWNNHVEDDVFEKIVEEEDDQSAVLGNRDHEHFGKMVDKTEGNKTTESKSEFSRTTPCPCTLNDFEYPNESIKNTLEEEDDIDLFSDLQFDSILCSGEQKPLEGSEQASNMKSEGSKISVDTMEEDDWQKEEEQDSVAESEENELTIKELEKLNAKQKEQWELAALGEWSLVCHDDDEDEESTNLYLMKDELQKEQYVRQNLKIIISKFQDLHVVKDFQKMLTLPGCPREQMERALRHYARICQGPVPLSVAGQSKAEAVASLSVNLRRRTKRFVQDQPCSFKEFTRVVEELDTLRVRQDSVEDFLKRSLRKEEARKRKVRTPQRRRKVKRWAPHQKLFLWEVDMIIMETYYLYEGKVRSSCRVDVMPTILESSEF